MSVLKLITPPTIEPVNFDEAADHLRIDADDQRLLIETYIKAARQYVEKFCGPLLTQTWEQYEQDWPVGDELKIGKPHLQAIESVKYTDRDGVQATLSSSTYTVDIVREYSPRIVLKDGFDWPSNELFNVNPIVVRFAAGYGDAPEDVPEPIRLAILFLVAHWFESREPVIIGGLNVHQVPMTVDALMAEYRIWQ